MWSGGSATLAQHKQYVSAAADHACMVFWQKKIECADLVTKSNF